MIINIKYAHTYKYHLQIIMNAVQNIICVCREWWKTHWTVKKIRTPSVHTYGHSRRLQLMSPLPPIPNIIIIDILIIIWCTKRMLRATGDGFIFYTIRTCAIILSLLSIIWFFLATAVVTPRLCSRNNGWVCRRLFFFYIIHFFSRFAVFILIFRSSTVSKAVFVVYIYTSARLIQY